MNRGVPPGWGAGMAESGWWVGRNATWLAPKQSFLTVPLTVPPDALINLYININSLSKKVCRKEARKQNVPFM